MPGFAHFFLVTKTLFIKIVPEDNNSGVTRFGEILPP